MRTTDALSANKPYSSARSSDLVRAPTALNSLRMTDTPTFRWRGFAWRVDGIPTLPWWNHEHRRQGYRTITRNICATGNLQDGSAYSVVRVVALRLHRAIRVLDHKAVETLPSFRRSG